MTRVSSFMARLAGAGLLLALSLTAPLTVQAQEPERSVGEIETIVRDYILSNPEVIVEALRELERREQAAADSARVQAITALAPTLTASPLTPVFGNEKGDVTLIEFFDYQCGFCKRMFPGLQAVMDNDEDLRVIFVELPILGPASVTAARAALAAQEQGKYLELHTALMTFQGRLSDDVVFRTAEELGLDLEQLQTDMQAPRINEYLGMTQALAEAMQVRGTPAMVIGDQFIGGFIQEDELRAIIAQTRESAG